MNDETIVAKFVLEGEEKLDFGRTKRELRELTRDYQKLVDQVKASDRAEIEGNRAKILSREDYNRKVREANDNLRRQNDLIAKEDEARIEKKKRADTDHTRHTEEQAKKQKAAHSSVSAELQAMAGRYLTVAAAVEGARKSFTAFADHQRDVNQLSFAVKASADELHKWEEQVKRLSAATGVEVNILNAEMRKFATATGMSLGDASKHFDNIVIAARLTGGEISTFSQLAGGAIRNLKIPLNEVEDVVKHWANTIPPEMLKAFAGVLPEITADLKLLGVTGKQFGLDFAAMMKQAGSSLSSPQEAAQQLGQLLKDAATFGTTLNMRMYNDMQQVREGTMTAAEAVKRLHDEMKAAGAFAGGTQGQNIREMFGVTEKQAIMLQKMAEGWDKIENNAKGAAQSVVEFNKAAKAMEGEAGTAIDRLSAGFKELSKQSGEALDAMGGTAAMNILSKTLEQYSKLEVLGVKLGALAPGFLLPFMAARNIGAGAVKGAREWLGGGGEPSGLERFKPGAALEAVTGSSKLSPMTGSGVPYTGKFAEGGAFTVPGTGGTDTTPVGFMATPGERVAVQTPLQESLQLQQDKADIAAREHFARFRGDAFTKQVAAPWWPGGAGPGGGGGGSGGGGGGGPGGGAGGYGTGTGGTGPVTQDPTVTTSPETPGIVDPQLGVDPTFSREQVVDPILARDAIADPIFSREAVAEGAKPAAVMAATSGGQTYGGTSTEKQKVAQIVANQFRAQGYKEHVIAGIMANIKSESEWNPANRHVDQDPRKWGGTEGLYSHGLYQEGGDEYNNWMKWMDKKGYPRDQWKDPRIQTEWIGDRLKQPQYAGLKKSLDESTTKEQAAVLFVQKYLKPAQRHQDSRSAQYRAGVPGVEHYTGTGTASTGGTVPLTDPAKPQPGQPGGVAPTTVTPGGGGVTGELGALPGQKDRPGSYQGTITVGGQTFRYGTGGSQRGSSPYGTYPVNIGKGDIGSVGQRIGSIATVGGSSGRIDDPKYPGAPRLGIQIHPATADRLDRMYTAGCFGVDRRQWPAFKAALLKENAAHGGKLFITVNKDGKAFIGPRQIAPTVAEQKQAGVQTGPTVEVAKPVAPPQAAAKQSAGWSPEMPYNYDKESHKSWYGNFDYEAGLTKHTSGEMSPYFDKRQSDTNKQYSEKALQPGSQGWNDYIGTQVDRAAASGKGFIEFDNLDHAYSRDPAAVRAAYNLAASKGLQVLLKNPTAAQVKDLGAMKTADGRYVVGGSVHEHGAMSPEQFAAARKAAGRDDLQGTFVRHGKQVAPDTSKIPGTTAQHGPTEYSGMKVTSRGPKSAEPAPKAAAAKESGTNKEPYVEGVYGKSSAVKTAAGADKPAAAAPAAAAAAKPSAAAPAAKPATGGKISGKEFHEKNKDLIEAGHKEGVPRQEGGLVEPGKTYTVGESGRETFVAGQPGQIIPGGGGFDFGGAMSQYAELAAQMSKPIRANFDVPNWAPIEKRATRHHERQRDQDVHRVGRYNSHQDIGFA